MFGKSLFKFNRGLPTALTGLLVFSVSALFADELRREVIREFPLSDRGQVEIENSIGKISVKTWDSSKVKVRVVKILDVSKFKDLEEAPDAGFLDRVEIRTESDSNTVRLQTIIPEMKITASNSGIFSGLKMLLGLFKGDCQRLPLSVEYELSVPERCNLRANCEIGEMMIQGVDGCLDLSSDIGCIETRNTSGVQHTRLSLGKITVSGVKGSVDAKSDMGQVEADFDSLGADDRVYLESGMGAVNLVLPSGSGIDLEAESDLGSVDAKLSDSFKGRSEWNSLRGKYNKGGASVTLKTGMGGIEIGSKPE